MLSEETSFPSADRFRILRRIGEGGMGVVYAAEDRELGTRVALKTLRSEDSESLLRLKKEFRSLQDLQHPNLISFGELFEVQGTWFFTMELIEGTSLLHHLWEGIDLDGFNRSNLTPEASRGPHNRQTLVSPPPDEQPEDREPSSKWAAIAARVSPDFARLRSCLLQLAHGLAALHASDRLHRDIKPGNIMVEESGRLVLMDFGLVTESDENLKSCSHFYPVGTSAYMSPEQAGSHHLTPASDWYSVGVVLFEALTGRLPFNGSFASVLVAKQREEAPDPAQMVPGLPEELVQLCRDLLQRDPDKRPGVEEVVRCLGGDAPPVEPAPEASLRRLDRIVGRHMERALLQEHFETFRERRELASLLVYGASGLGKSELVRSFLQDHVASQPDTVVFAGRCYEQESVSFKAIDPIIDALSQFLLRLPVKELYFIMPQNVQILIRVFPVLARVEAFAETHGRRLPTEDLLEIRSLAFNALRELFSRLATLFRVVVFIDDFQWADADSLKLLRVLLEPPAPPPLLFLLAQRTAQGPQVACKDVQATVDALPLDVTTLQVTPLNLQDSVALARKLAAVEAQSGAISEDDLQKISAEGGGHPLFIHELVRHLQTPGQQDRASRVLLLDDALWDRIALLPEQSRHIVEILSVAGTPAPLSVLATVLHKQPGDLQRTLTQLRLDNLIKTRGRSGHKVVETYHDRVREAVVNRLDTDTSRDWHRRLAVAFDDLGGASADTLAYHYLGAGDVPRAREFLVTAARDANKACAFQRASALFSQAIALWDQDDVAADPVLRGLYIEQGEALSNAGRGQEAAHAYLSALPGSSKAGATELRRVAGGLLMRSGHVNEGMDVMVEDLHSMKVALPRQGWRTIASLLWQRLRLRLRGFSFKARDESQIPLTDLVQVDIFRSISDGVGGRDVLRGAALTTRWVHVALNLGEPRRVLEALSRELNYNAASGKGGSRAQRRVLEAIDQTLRRFDHPWIQGYLEGAKAFHHYMEGDFADALGFATTAAGIFEEEHAYYWERAQMNLLSLWSLFFLGDWDRMALIAKRNLSDAMDRDDLISASSNMLGLNNVVFLNMEGPERTRKMVEELMSRWGGDGYQLQHWWSQLAHIQIDYYLGDRDRARARLDAEMSVLKKSLTLMVPSIHNQVAILRVRNLLDIARLAPDPRRSPALKAAIKGTQKLSKKRFHWIRAIAAALDAEAMELAGRPEEGVAGLREAITLLEEQHMALYVATSQHKLGTILGGDEGQALLDASAATFTAQHIASPEGVRRILLP